MDGKRDLRVKKMGVGHEGAAERNIFAKGITNCKQREGWKAELAWRRVRSRLRREDA